MKILHFSDLHLDKAFASLGMTSRIGDQRRQELRNALRKILDVAKEQHVDAVTIGGDLFEHERISEDTARFLQDQFARITPTRVIIAPGNHDPYVPESIYQRIEWPSNVHIFRELRFSQIALAKNIILWGAAHNGPSLRENLLQSLRLPETAIHVLLFHGSDLENIPSGDKVTHAPFKIEDLRATGAKFALLGHYHSASVRPQESPLYCYPGSPEPLGFDEEGTHHVLLLEVSENAVAPKLIPINQVQYHQEEVDISNVNSSEDIRVCVEELSKEWEQALVRLTLTGTPHPDVDVNVDALLAECAPKFRYLDIRNRTDPAYNLEELQTQLTAKGRFVKKMRGRIGKASDQERPILERALRSGLQALDRREIRP